MLLDDSKVMTIIVAERWEEGRKAIFGKSKKSNTENISQKYDNEAQTIIICVNGLKREDLG